MIIKTIDIIPKETYPIFKSRNKYPKLNTKKDVSKSKGIAVIFINDTLFRRFWDNLMSYVLKTSPEEGGYNKAVVDEPCSKVLEKIRVNTQNKGE
jgi:hypothetical protein